MLSSRTSAAIFVIYALVMAVGVLRIESRFSWPDEVVYFRLASNLYHHHIYSEDGTTVVAYKPPGFASFLAAVYSLHSSLAFLRRVNLGLWLVAAVLCSRVCFCLFGAIGQRVCLLLILCYPVTFYTAMFLYPQTLATVLFLAAVYLLLKATSDTIKFELAAGACLGALLMTVPMFLFSLPILLAWVAAKHRSFARKPLAVMLSCALIASLWSVRNFRVFGRFVPFGNEGGHELLLGNSENTLPNAGPNTDLSSYTRYVKRNHLDEVEADHFYRDSAVRWIVGHPASAVRLYALKWLNWFNFKNDLHTTSQSSVLAWAVMFFTWYPLLALGLCAVLLDRNVLSLEEIMLCAVYLTGAFSYALFYTRLRYRVPFDYILIVLASGFITRRLSKAEA